MNQLRKSCAVKTVYILREYDIIMSGSMMMTTGYRKGNRMDHITVNAALDRVRAVTSFVNGHLEALGCPERIRILVDVAIDEIFSNIVYYAYRRHTGQETVRVEVKEDPLGVAITFIDHGAPYDPLAEERPDITKLPARERPIGGLGLFMVKRTMDDISYDYKDGRNILTIRKKI